MIMPRQTGPAAPKVVRVNGGGAMAATSPRGDGHDAARIARVLGIRQKILGGDSSPGDVPSSGVNGVHRDLVSGHVPIMR